MSLETNKELVRRLFEEDLNGDNRDVADTIFAVDFVDHTNPPQWKHGLDGHKAVVSYFKQAFPDCRWTIIEMIAEGDKVVARVFYTGTHTGDFFGIPATGK